MCDCVWECRLNTTAWKKAVGECRNKHNIRREAGSRPLALGSVSEGLHTHPYPLPAPIPSRLCRQPYQILEAGDAREGLHAAATLRPVLIVLDLNLPDRRGEEVLRELASAEATSAIPVVIATSETLSREARERLRGAAGVYSKAKLDRQSFERLLESLRPGATASRP